MLREKLTNLKFEDFHFNCYFYRDKFTGGISDIPRHEISEEELKKVYEKRESIKRGFKRKTKLGDSYTICYEESTNVFVKIGYIFSKNPPEIFMGLRIYRNLEKALQKRYGLII